MILTGNGISMPTRLALFTSTTARMRKMLPKIKQEGLKRPSGVVLGRTC